MHIRLWLARMVYDYFDRTRRTIIYVCKMRRVKLRHIFNKAYESEQLLHKMYEKRD